MLLSHDPTTKPTPKPFCRHWPALVMLQQLGLGTPLPMRSLNEGLASSLVQQFGDDVQVIVAVPDTAARPTTGSNGWTLTPVPVPGDDPDEALKLLYAVVKAS